MTAIDFYEYRKDVARKLLSLANTLNIDEDPLEYAWIVYGLSNMDSECNLILEHINTLKRWMKSQEIRKEKKELPKEYLPVISSYLYVLQRCSLRISQDDIDLALALLSKELSKFNNSSAILQRYSLFNIPEAVFLISVGLSKFVNPEIKKNLRDIIVKLGEYGSSKRKTLYHAANFELSPEKGEIPLEIKECVHSAESAEDIITLLWFLRRYDQMFINEQSEKWGLQSILWKRLAKIEPLLDETLSNSGITLALFYEVVLYETTLPNPHVLFDNYPLHPEVRRVSEGLYKKGEYLSAVFEAAKAFDRYVQKLTNAKDSKGKDLFGYALFDKTMNPGKNIGDKNPLIKFNNLKTATEFSEQSGIWHLALGVHLAFRNPKGHQPKTTLNINAYEALDQLVVISYLFKRVEKATITKNNQRE